MKTAIASTITTLEDYLKTDVCAGMRIHCQFSPTDAGEYYFLGKLEQEMLKVGIGEIVFNDGTVLRVG